MLKVEETKEREKLEIMRSRVQERLDEKRRTEVQKEVIMKEFKVL